MAATQHIKSYAASAVISFCMASACLAEEAPKPEYVESHDVLLMDVSASMDQLELAAAFKGVADYYLSDEAKHNYGAGMCTANTVIFFGTTTLIKDTMMICKESDVQAFVLENITNLDLNYVRKITNNSTETSNGLLAVGHVFSQEAEMNIVAGRHRVVLISDEAGGADIVLGANSKILSTQFGATVHAFSLGSAELAEFFRRAVITQPETYRTIKLKDGKGYQQGVAAGVATYALNGQDISTKLKDLLSLGGF